MYNSLTILALLAAVALTFGPKPARAGMVYLTLRTDIALLEDGTPGPSSVRNTKTFNEMDVVNGAIADSGLLDFSAVSAGVSGELDGFKVFSLHALASGLGSAYYRQATGETVRSQFDSKASAVWMDAWSVTGGPGGLCRRGGG